MLLIRLLLSGSVPLNRGYPPRIIGDLLGGVLPWRKNKLVFSSIGDFYGPSWGQGGFGNDREP